MMIWQSTMKNKTNKNNHHHHHNNNSGRLHINNIINEKSIFTCGRTVEGALRYDQVY